MKAPNVIYVISDSDGLWAYPGQPFTDTPAYIRKDVLINFLKKKKEQADSIEDAYAVGKSDAFNEVFEKIESL